MQTFSINNIVLTKKILLILIITFTEKNYVKRDIDGKGQSKERTTQIKGSFDIDFILEIQSSNL